MNSIPTGPTPGTADSTIPHSKQPTQAEPQHRRHVGRPVSLRYRLSSLVLSCVLPVWIVAGVLVHRDYRAKRATTEARMLESARAISFYLDRELSNMQASLNVLATARSLAAGDMPNFYRRAQEVLQQYPGAVIVLADATGRQLINTYLPFGADLPRRANLESTQTVFATGKPTTSNVFRGAISGNPIVSLDTPVFRDGRVVYDLAIAAPAEYFGNILSRQRLASEWVMCILDSNYALVARNRSGEPSAGEHAGAGLEQRMREAAEGTAEITDSTGVRMISAFSRSSASGWAVSVSLPKAVVLADLRRWLGWTVAGVVLLLFTGIVVALRMAGGIAGSIRGLIPPALALGHGQAITVEPSDLQETCQLGESLLKASELMQKHLEERVQAEAARHESEALKQLNIKLASSEAEAGARATELAGIMDAVPAHIYIAHDRDCDQVTANRAGAALYGLPPGENASRTTLQKVGWAFHHRFTRNGAELPIGELPLRRATSTGQVVRNCEYSIEYADGVTRDLLGNAVPLFDDSGHVCGAVSSSVDITELKQAQAELQRTAVKLQTILADAPIGINVTDRDGRLLEANPRYCLIVGRPAEELIGKTFADHTHPDDVDESLRLRRNLRDSGGKLYEREKRYIRPDGKVIWVRLKVSAFDHDFAVAAVEDITEQVLMQEKLRQTVRRLELILEKAPLGINVTDLNGQIVDANPAFERITGYSLDELKSMSYLDFTHPDDRPSSHDHLDRGNSGDQSSDQRDKRYIRKDGSTVWVRRSTASVDEEHRISMVEDITNRKQTEEALQEAIRLNQQVLDSVQEGVIVYGPDLRYRLWNRFMEDLTGIAAKDAIGRHPLELFPFLADAGVIGQIKNVLAGEPGKAIDFPYHIPKSGRKGWTSDVSSPLRNAAGEVIGVIATVREITDRKQSEDALQKSAAKFRAVIDNSHEGVSFHDAQGNVLYRSSSAFLVNGYSNEERIGRSHFELVHPDDLAAVNASWIDVLNHPGQVTECHYRMKYKFGTWRQVEVSLLNLLQDPNVQAVVLTARDITKRRRAEEALRASEARMRLFIEHAPAALAMFDRDMRYIAASRRWSQDYNLGDRQLIGKSHYEIFPEIPDEWKEAHRQGLAGEIIRAEGDYFGRADGSEQWVKWEIRPWYGALGEVGGILIFTEDVTERKQAEEALRKSEARSRENEARYLAMVQAFDGFIYVYSKDYRIEFVNRQAIERTGRDITGEVCYQAIHGLDSPCSSCVFERVQRGETVREEMQNRNDGRWLYCVHAPIFHADGTVSHQTTMQDISDRKRAEEELRKSTQQLLAVTKCIPDMIWSSDLSGRFSYVSPAVTRLYGWTPEELMDQSFSCTSTAEEAQRLEAILRVEKEKAKSPDYDRGRVFVEEFERVRKDGTRFWAEIAASLAWSDSGQPTGWIGITRDITERRRAAAEQQRLSEQLAQAQKMESVGRLAGGVAHDFNNLLTVIQGFTEMLQSRLPADDRLRHYTQQILSAAERAAGLTGQLLAFSRKQIIAPVALNLNAIVLDTAKMLKRLIGEDIELNVDRAEPLWTVDADPDQMTQILVNLAVNARDAMPYGGQLTIATRQVTVGGGSSALPDSVEPGEYVAFSIADTGTGISGEIKDRIFEPFFTTKEVGKGTGLGLSTVYGIVKQNGGHIWVDSEPGRGSCFTILLPRGKQAVSQPPEALGETSPRTRGTLLIVEDEDAVRNGICEFLTHQSYEVLSAKSGQEAMKIAAEYRGNIDVLVTDVVMPKMSGRELAEALKLQRPRVKILLMSGYTEDEIVRRGVQRSGAAFLQKPFKLTALARKVAEILG